MISSVFYTISYFALLLGIILIRKSEKKQNVLIWSVLSIMTSFAVQAFFASIFYITKMPVGIVSIGAADAIAAVGLWILIIRNGSQKYYIDIIDIIAFLLLFFVAGCIYYKRFALGYDISFASIDSATTYGLTKIIVLEHRIPTNMFFSLVNSALPMEAMIPITGPFYMFRVFILWETGYFYMSALFFYIMIRSLLKSKGLKVIGIVSSVIYMLGYPLNNIVFGFSYFSLSISVISYIVYSTMLYIDDDVKRSHSLIMLNLGLLGLFLCYMMFVPAIFIGVLVSIGVFLAIEKKLFSWKTIVTGLKVFLLPSIIGLIITASNLIFITKSDVVAEATGGTASIALAIDGGCYNDMYSNFIILLPFVIVGLIICLKKIKANNKDQKASAIEIVIPSIYVCMFAFAAILFINAMKGYVSIYYYVKVNNVFMLLSWSLIIIAFAELWDKSKEIIIAYISVISFLLIIIFTGVDEKIIEKNERFIRVGAENFLDLYYFNKEYVKYSGDLNSDDIKLLEYANDNLVLNENAKNPEVAVVGGTVYTAWYASMTSNDNIKKINASIQLQDVNLLDYKYICVQNTVVYDENRELFDNLGNVLYSNTRGKIIEIK